MSRPYSGRGTAHRGGGPFGGNRSWRMPEVVRSAPPPMGDLIETVSREDVLYDKAGPLGRIGISGAEVIASYNWLDERHPEIIIPGTTVFVTHFSNDLLTDNQARQTSAVDSPSYSPPASRG
ncbi:uncharacterized protein MAM_02570 [Metarhizium album ARSEF 1941]|uniref:Uncharacterized protein n=1 Tax=Metarhizium album (strain ARSEF 1941) TaxID=1081103 RepID=A0A0B2X1W5_METAS|nr:uncharacterized protein MAM_02570 [Metarhizium album ARSEF 1941]KHN99717.1 hypothetical protein MAM_02570 [Metarhizium album ARSEF 1941]